jgi:hypothetical protein
MPRSPFSSFNPVPAGTTQYECTYTAHISIPYYCVRIKYVCPRAFAEFLSPGPCGAQNSEQPETLALLCPDAAPRSVLSRLSSRWCV